MSSVLRTSGGASKLSRSYAFLSGSTPSGDEKNSAPKIAQNQNKEQTSNTSNNGKKPKKNPETIFKPLAKSSLANKEAKPKEAKENPKPKPTPKPKSEIMNRLMAYTKLRKIVITTNQRTEEFFDLLISWEADCLDSSFLKTHQEEALKIINEILGGFYVLRLHNKLTKHKLHTVKMILENYMQQPMNERFKSDPSQDLQQLFYISISLMKIGMFPREFIDMMVLILQDTPNGQSRLNAILPTSIASFFGEFNSPRTISEDQPTLVIQ